MSSNGISEREREITWDRVAKGRGNRWRMIRDLVAILSLNSMNLVMIQDSMFRLRGLTRPKVLELLQELQRAGDVKEVVGESQGIQIHAWTATDQGVALWLNNSRKSIPARLAMVASTMRFAVRSEASQNESSLSEVRS